MIHAKDFGIVLGTWVTEECGNFDSEAWENVGCVDRLSRRQLSEDYLR